MNVTVCLTQSTTASFTCVVDRGGRAIFSTGWHILSEGQYVLVPDSGKPCHMISRSIDEDGDIITDILTVTNVSVNDNGTLYRCQPLINVTSISATLTVLGESGERTSIYNWSYPSSCRAYAGSTSLPILLGYILVS